MPNYFKQFPTVEYMGRTVTDITKRSKILQSLSLDPYAFLPYTIHDDMRPEDVAYFYYGDVDKVWMVFLANNIIDPYTQWPLPGPQLDATIRAKYARVLTPDSRSGNILKISNHGMKITDPLIYESLTPIGGLTSGATYYVIPTDQNHLALASSAANVIANTRLTLTSFPTGTHTLTRDLDQFLLSTNLRCNVVYCIRADGIKISYDTFTSTIIEVGDYSPVFIYDWEVEQNESKRTIWLINAAYANQMQADLKKVMNV